MTELTKNQHFVPRLLLRNFAGGEDGVVQVFDSQRGVHRPQTSVRRVFSQNYFYDDDNVVESFLAKHVERPAAPIIEAIVRNPGIAIPNESIELFRFICVQMNRTPGALDTVIELIDKSAETVFQRLGELNDFPAEDMAKLKLRLQDERALLGSQTVEGALNWPLVRDLSWHVLSNGTSLPFVISDNPVVRYNWYLRDSTDPSYTSLTKHGVQVFMPLSPAVTLALVDKSIYKFGKKHCHHSVLLNTQDVELLNALQFRSRQSFIVFPENLSACYVKERCKTIPAGSIFENHAWSSEPVQADGGNYKSTHAVWRTQARFSHWLSISKVKRKIFKGELLCRDREPEAVEAQRAFIKMARESRRRAML